MKYKTSFSCLFAGLLAFGLSGLAHAEYDDENGASKQAQTISFSPASASIVLGGTVSITATATSGLSVSLRQDPTTAKFCSFNQNSGLVTALSVGICKIDAYQRGNAAYAAASSVLSVQITQSNSKLQNQTISFGAAPKITVGGTGTVTATATSGLAVALSSKTPSVCTLSGNTVKGLATGLCTIAADQAGNASYAAAPEVSQSFNVAQQVSGGGTGGNGGNGGNAGNGGTKLAVTAPFNCNTLVSSGNAADDGRRAYVRLNCVACHAQDASGGMGPDIRGETGDVAEAVNGEGAMPSFAGFLCPNDVTDLEAYLGSIANTKKYLDWDVHLEQILDGTAAAKPVNVVPGP